MLRASCAADPGVRAALIANHLQKPQAKLDRTRAAVRSQARPSRRSDEPIKPLARFLPMWSFDYFS